MSFLYLAYVSSLSMLFELTAKFAGRETLDGPETLGEITLASESRFITDFRDIFVSLKQQFHAL
jgi:hypothetical protein